MINDQQIAFRDRVVALAKKIGPKYGVDWRLMAATAIFESGWGKSGLARRSFNLFGIKATVSTPEDEIYFLHGEPFRKFKSEAAACRSYGWLMSQSSHYERARCMARETALKVFVANMATVYCPPDSEYATKIMRLVDMLDEAEKETT